MKKYAGALKTLCERYMNNVLRKSWQFGQIIVQKLTIHFKSYDTLTRKKRQVNILLNPVTNKTEERDEINITQNKSFIHLAHKTHKSKRQNFRINPGRSSEKGMI